MRLIIDASVALKWVIDEGDAEQADSLERFDLMTTDLMWCECADIMWRLVQRGQITAEQAHSKLKRLQAVNIATLQTDSLAARALEIAIELQHPACDAFYLAAAERHSIQVVTADVRLLNKLRSVAQGRFAPLATSSGDVAD